MEKPLLYEKKYYKHRFYYEIRFDLEYDDVKKEWAWKSSYLPYGVFDYDAIVNAIIQNKYPSDKMQAIINNYLLDPNDSDAKLEFNKMQEWRKYAKNHAKEILNS